MVILAVSAEEITSLIENNEVVFIILSGYEDEREQFFSHFTHCATQYKTIVFAKANVEAQIELRQIFCVDSVPQLMIFKQGNLIYYESGAMSEATLLGLIEQTEQFDLRAIKKPGSP